MGISINQLVRDIILLLLVIAALIFFVRLLWGGIRYIVSGGDKGATESARSRITSALIGVIIVFAIWVILQLISSLLALPPT
jgi:hypothetical protein